MAERSGPEHGTANIEWSDGRSFAADIARSCRANPTEWQSILDAEKRGNVTLLYSAHDVLHNGAVVLREYLMDREALRSSRGKGKARPRAGE